jgi:hypothetical protein
VLVIQPPLLPLDSAIHLSDADVGGYEPKEEKILPLCVEVRERRGVGRVSTVVVEPLLEGHIS